MSQAANDVDVLGNLENVMIISNILKTNVAACSSIGSSYISQIGRIFLDMLGLYRAVGGIISETVSREGIYHPVFSDPSVMLTTPAQGPSPLRNQLYDSCGL
jgi:hypothetical protein